MTNSSNQYLNLREGASISEIKAAYRRLVKTCHPDTAGNDPQNVEKFIKAQTAYQKLMKKAVAHNRARRHHEAPEPLRPENKPNGDHVADNWRFESSREVGLDIYYRLSLKRPVEGSGCRVLLPWQAREACPRCLGQGRTLVKIGLNELYRPTACGNCGGSGSLNRESRLEAIITPLMVGKDKIRLRRAGLYDPKEAKRGDLILEVNWVDQFPKSNLKS